MKYYSNEIVFRGHPDKVCDQISGALLDAYLKGDRNTRAGIEVVGGKNKIFITGEVTSSARVNVEEVVRRVLSDVGYHHTPYKIINNIGTQSEDIAPKVNAGGAGDNGMMFGYACDDTKELLPTAMVILQRLSKAYDELRRELDDFLPDGKAQITGEYDDEFRLIKIKTFTICYQNKEVNRKLTDYIVINLAKNICNDYNIEVEKFLINPSGRFLLGGFDADAGVTGRKIVVDTYQSFANVGGGSLNGKDPSKVDLSGAYKARDIAVRFLKFFNLRWCEVQLSYAIGVAQPTSIYINSDKGYLDPYLLSNDKECEPKNIISDLRLLDISYEEQAKFGHFKDVNLTYND